MKSSLGHFVPNRGHTVPILSLKSIRIKPHVWDCWVSLVKFHKKLRFWTVGINFWKFYPVKILSWKSDLDETSCRTAGCP